MALSSLVVAAYRRIYSRAQMMEALAAALSDRASGVTITQVNFQDGGGAAVPIKGDPNEIIEILELCLQQIDGTAGDAAPPLTSTANFSLRRSET
jgi:hypothetical protein